MSSSSNSIVNDEGSLIFESESAQIIIYTLASIVILFYLSHILLIWHSRKTIYNTYMPFNCISTSMTSTFMTLYTTYAVLSEYMFCFLSIWSLYVILMILGSSYVVKCVKMIIYLEWRESIYNSETTTATNTTLSSSNSSGNATHETEYSGDSTRALMHTSPIQKRRQTVHTLQEPAVHGNYDSVMYELEQAQKHYQKQRKENILSRRSRFILRYRGLSEDKNLIKLFFILLISGCVIPAIINITRNKYRNEPLGDCNDFVLGEYIALGFVALFYIGVCITTLILLRGKCDGMLLKRHLSNIAICWAVGLGIFITLSAIELIWKGTTVLYFISQCITLLIFMPAFVGEVVLPWIQYYRTQRHNKVFASLFTSVDSITDIFQLYTSDKFTLDLLQDNVSIGGGGGATLNESGGGDDVVVDEQPISKLSHTSKSISDLNRSDPSQLLGSSSSMNHDQMMAITMDRHTNNKKKVRISLRNTLQCLQNYVMADAQLGDIKFRRILLKKLEFVHRVFKDRKPNPQFNVFDGQQQQQQHPYYLGVGNAFMLWLKFFSIHDDDDDEIDDNNSVDITNVSGDDGISERDDIVLDGDHLKPTLDVIVDDVTRSSSSNNTNPTVSMVGSFNTRNCIGQLDKNSILFFTTQAHKQDGFGPQEERHVSNVLMQLFEENCKYLDDVILMSFKSTEYYASLIRYLMSKKKTRKRNLDRSM